jgi:uncharacterized protein with NAD-binding domain and iron-sulfur cluster
MAASGRKRIAVLGGGCGAMTAAYYLSRTPELQAQYEVTVYQMGWRLGGKGASGRRLADHARIEEHGLHVWGGFYHNAFRMMRECYSALGRPATAPLATWDQAFLPKRTVAWEERVGDEWKNWIVEVPPNSGVPGESGELPTPLEYFEELIGFLRNAMANAPHESLRAMVTHEVFSVADAAIARLRSLGGDHSATVDHLVSHLDGFDSWLEEAGRDLLMHHDEARRTYIIADLALALARGIIRDGVIERGWLAVDDVDFADWLKSHGASALALQSAPLRGYYDYFFAYQGGDPGKPRMSASMGLYHLLRLVFTYKGTLFYKMASGMGDAVFGPIYELCRRNGVRFEFFHEVRELVPGGDGSIEEIRINKQVRTAKQYEPLIDVGGLPSWPATPLFDQIDPTQAARLDVDHVDLEDPWNGWDGDAVVLRAGADYDTAILGIPVGAFPAICARLIAQDQKWATMVGALETIQTQALQIWWTRAVDGLGWSFGNTTGTGYGQPFESWSDMSQVVARERWSGDGAARSVVYFCGPMPTASAHAGHEGPEFGRSQEGLARDAALAWSVQNLGHLYPGAVREGEIDWGLLAAPADVEGPARFGAQYVRANYTPSERYVLDLPGTSMCRLEAGGSGFANLILAGDWVFTGLGGAVESAVIGGMQAAEAVLGVSLDVVGAIKKPASSAPR